MLTVLQLKTKKSCLHLLQESISLVRRDTINIKSLWVKQNFWNKKQRHVSFLLNLLKKKTTVKVNTFHHWCAKPLSNTRSCGCENFVVCFFAVNKGCNPLLCTNVLDKQTKCHSNIAADIYIKKKTAGVQQHRCLFEWVYVWWRAEQLVGKKKRLYGGISFHFKPATSTLSVHFVSFEMAVFILFWLNGEDLSNVDINNSAVRVPNYSFS